MAIVDEQLSSQFRAWEQRGRGWKVWDAPVSPEPPFRHFPGHFIDQPRPVDDGRKPTALSSFVQKLSQRLSTENIPPVIESTPEEEPEPESQEREDLVEILASLPAKVTASPEAFGLLLSALSYRHEPITFELLGSAEKLLTQFVTHPSDAPSVIRGLQAHFPNAAFTQTSQVLREVWDAAGEYETAIVEFGLAREFMFLLNSKGHDVLIGLSAALSSLQERELGLYQVIFQPVEYPWAESVLRAVSDTGGKPAFVNAPDLLSQGREKVSKPIFAVVVRIATRAETFDRAWEIARDMAGALRGFGNLQGNELIPLHNEDYPSEVHEMDVLKRQSRRSGMLLNQDELLAFVHLPSPAVQSAKLLRYTAKTKALPKALRSNQGILIGHNTHAGKVEEVRLTADQRVRHTHIIGTSGTGKSSLLYNMILQDIENGQGVAVLDPHGDLIDKILGAIPENRIDDVILVDPADEEYSVGFNILSAHSDLERNLLASDLVSIFERLSASWGDQMGSVLQNAIFAFLESSRGGTLSDLQKFLADPSFRNEYLETVKDPDVVFYWKRVFPQLTGNKSIGPILNRLNNFLLPKPIRYMVSQPENRLDFGEILDTGKIFLAKLSQGLIGGGNSFLLGSLFLGKFQQIAMMRQSKAESTRRDFWLYADEFQNFITPSMAEILTGVRKYRLGLILAHHDLQQLHRSNEVESAVLSVHTRIVYRVEDSDARALSGGFSSFEPSDLQNLNTGEAICRVERNDQDFNLTVPYPLARNLEAEAHIRQTVIAVSRKKYATPRADLTAQLPIYGSVHYEKSKDSGRDTVQPVPQVKPSPIIDHHPPEVVGSPEVKENLQSDRTKQRNRPPPEKEAGAGGEQHKALQKRFKDVGEKLGYSVAIESVITGKNKRIDLRFERPGQAIACEIAMTTTIDHEFGNVRKCIQEGLKHIAVVCILEDRLAKIEKAVSRCLPAEESSLVKFFLPDAFISYLGELAKEQLAPCPPNTRVHGKYTVTKKTAEISAQERRMKQASQIDVIKSLMRMGGSTPPS